MMKDIERRDFLQKLGAGAVGLAGLNALADVTTDGDANTSYAPHVHRIGIRGRMDRDRLDAHFVAGTMDAERDLAAIGDQQLLDLGHRLTRRRRAAGRTRRAGRWRRAPR